MDRAPGAPAIRTSEIRTVLTDRVDIPELAGVYRAVHASDLDLIDHSDPPVEQRLEWTAQAPGFAATVGHHGDRVVGAVLGCPLPPETQWWRDLRPSAASGRSGAEPAVKRPESRAIQSDLVREWPGRTFAVCEAFVLPEFRRHQVGVELFSRLLASRTEQRASLAVADTNTGVSRSLRVLGWAYVGDIQPFPGWRQHGMFVRPLPWHGARE